MSAEAEIEKTFLDWHARVCSEHIASPVDGLILQVKRSFRLTKAPRRKRPKRVAKKIAARCGHLHCGARIWELRGVRLPKEEDEVICEIT